MFAKYLARATHERRLHRVHTSDFVAPGWSDPVNTGDWVMANWLLSLWLQCYTKCMWSYCRVYDL